METTRNTPDAIKTMAMQIEELTKQVQNLEETCTSLRSQLEESNKKNEELSNQLKDITEKMSNTDFKNIVSKAKASSFKSYMDYRTITNRTSYAYQLQKQAYTDNNGLRKIGDYYCVAMGTYYGNVGDTYYIETDEGACWKVILADIKSDKHTDRTHSYTRANGCMMEFIVDTNKMPRATRLSGTVNGLGFQGKITVVRHV